MPGTGGSSKWRAVVIVTGGGGGGFRIVAGVGMVWTVVELVVLVGAFAASGGIKGSEWWCEMGMLFWGELISQSRGARVRR